MPQEVHDIILYHFAEIPMVDSLLLLDLFYCAICFKSLLMSPKEHLHALLVCYDLE